MTFEPIDISLNRTSLSLPKIWYGSPTIPRIFSGDYGFLKNAGRGSGSIRSGTKFVKDEQGQPVPHAEIFCYLQSKNRLELIETVLCDVNGLWEIQDLNKKHFYTIVARYQGFENTICSNVYPV